MEEETFMQEIERDLSNMKAIDVEDEEDDYISTVRSTNEWNEYRNDLAKKMFEEYIARRRQIKVLISI